MRIEARCDYRGCLVFDYESWTAHLMAGSQRVAPIVCRLERSLFHGIKHSTRRGGDRFTFDYRRRLAELPSVWRAQRERPA